MERERERESKAQNENKKLVKEKFIAFAKKVLLGIKENKSE